MLIKRERFPGMSGFIFSMMPSSFKRGIYRRKGYKIGKNVKFGFGSLITGKEVDIGDNTTIGFFSIIKAKKLKINKRVKIASMVYIDAGVVEIDDDAIIGEMVGIGGILTPKSYLRIGKRCHVFPYSILNPTYPLILDDDSSCGYANYIFTHGSWKSILEGYPVTFGPITVGKGVWLPSRVQIMPNVKIGDNAVIGAGSIVNKDIPAGCLAIGTPAKVIKRSGEFPPKVNQKKKKEILIKIINDFAAYLNYLDIKTEILKEKDYIKLVIFHDKRYMIYVFLNSIEYKKCDCIISLNKINKDDVRDVQFFDIESKQYRGEGDLIDEIRSYFSRFGIRFEKI